MSAHRVPSLHEAGREVTSILELKPLLKRVAEMVKGLVDYDLFCVMPFDEKERVLGRAFSWPPDSRFCRTTKVPLGTGISGTAAAERRPVRVGDVERDPRFVHCDQDVRVRSELAAPLVVKDRLIGVINLESERQDAFDEQHERMLTTLASYIAIAVENAQLYERVRLDERRYAEDLAMAREIQKDLLPGEAPVVPGLEVAFAYQPARELSGDFYDFLPYGENRLAVAVGDVAGKASAAALRGSLVVGLLRGFVVERPDDPAVMLERLNRHLQQSGPQNRFVAMAFAVYDAKDRTMAIADAGFPRPLLLRDGKVEEIPLQGTPLGLLPGVGYEQTKLALREGDLVVLCSDGIQEGVNERDEEFGLRRVTKLLEDLAASSPREIAEGILRACNEHVGAGAEPADDRTVVVLAAPTRRSVPG